MKKNYFKLLKRVVLLAFIFLTLLEILSPIKETLGYMKKKIEFSNESYTEDIPLNNEIIFNGVFDSYMWYFNLDKNTSVTNINVSLNYQVSDLIKNGLGSYLTFSINSVKFKSIQLTEDNIEIQSISLEIPLDLLTDGHNELKIEGYLRLSEKPCTDDYNTANWLILKKQSSLSITKKNIIPQNDLSAFPYPFVNEGGYSETSIIIPNEYSDGELTAAFQVEALLGKNNGKATIYEIDDIREITNSNIIFIGRAENTPNVIKSNIDNFSEDSISNTALISIGKSPFSIREDVKMLSIISSVEKELLAAVKLLMNNNLISQVNGAFTYVNSNMNLEEESRLDEGEFTFSELGYNEMTFQGLFRNDITMGYSLPKNRNINPGDKISINMRYAENLDFNRSLFTVYINGIPLGSKKLSKEKANGDSLSLLITEDVAKSTYVEVKLVFDLYVNDVDCETKQSDDPWALILGNSTIGINTRSVNDYYFNTYPAPFISNWEANEVLFVLPDTLTSDEITALGKVASFMGQSIKYNGGTLEVARVSNLDKEDRNKNIILYGTPENNSIIREINNNLWFKYKDDFSMFLPNEKLYLMDDFASKMTTFQLDISPFNREKNILVITSVNEDLLFKSLIFLNDSKNFEKLQGDGVVIDEYGNVRSYKYKEEKKEPAYKYLKNLNVTSKTLLLLIVLLGIFIVVAAGLFFHKNKNRSRE